MNPQHPRGAGAFDAVADVAVGGGVGELGGEHDVVLADQGDAGVPVGLGGLEVVVADLREGAALFGAQGRFQGVAAEEGEGVQERGEGVVAGDDCVGVGRAAG